MTTATPLWVHRRRYRRRRWTARLAALAVGSAFLLAVVPLILVLTYTIARGLPHFSWVFFTHSLAGVPPSQAGGGIAAATIGSLEQVGLASLIGLPLGLAVAVYLAEYGTGRLATVTRFLVDVMTGIPSIVAGLFAYTFIVISLHQGFSGLAAAIALSLLMVPIIVRSAEDILAGIPRTLREAGYALGLRRWRVVVSIVLPAARSGLITGAMLAVARIAGETAPLLLTAFDNSYINANPFRGQQSALPLFIYNQAQQAYQPAIDRAWAAAATLVLAITGIYIIARLLTLRKSGAHRV
ncbi:MAG: phosphate ABC transporter permease PstA [Acidothermus sp.]|nr:phosphate ABC transporter permease PstA [Acidothermus sp.]